MFFVGMLIGAIIGASVGGFAMAAACIAKNADLIDEIDRMRGGADAQ
jgi:hypothetical protein